MFQNVNKREVASGLTQGGQIINNLIVNKTVIQFMKN